MKFNNKYYILRHGEALSNVKDIVSSWPETFFNPLTHSGVAKVRRVAKSLKNKNIELIFASPLLRTMQTAGIVAEACGLKPKVEKRLRELDFGTFNGCSTEDFVEYFKNKKERISRRIPKGENYKDLLERVWGFFKEVNKKYKGKTILIVSHQAPLLILLGKVKGHSMSESMDGVVKIVGEKKIVTAQLIEIN